MKNILLFLNLFFLSCIGQTEVPLSWNYDPGDTVRFYIYSYSAADTTVIDSAQIVLMDSLDSSGLSEYNIIVKLQLQDYTCFFAKAVRQYQNYKVYSRYSNRTLFIEATEAPRNLTIP